MIILESYSNYALLISNAMLLGAAALAIVRFQRQLRSASKFWDSPTGSALQAQCDQSMFNQATEERIASLQDTVARIEQINGNISQPPEKLPFENAVRMAQAGASLEDLVRTCGLSHGEARLFMRIHAKSAA
jgi:hypothetical protein